MNSALKEVFDNYHFKGPLYSVYNWSRLLFCSLFSIKNFKQYCETRWSIDLPSFYVLATFNSVTLSHASM